MNISEFIDGAEEQMRRMQELVDYQCEKAARYRVLADAEADPVQCGALLKEADELERSAAGWEDTRRQLAELVGQLKSRSPLS